jgi:Tol biopolymer transport system component
LGKLESMKRRMGLVVVVAFATATSCRATSQDPIVVAIDPSWVTVSELPTPVHLVGEGLFNRVQLTIDKNRPARVQSPRVVIGGIELSEPHVNSTSEITASVPAELTIGTYDVEVTLPNGKTITLRQAFTIAEDGSGSPQTGPSSTGTSALVDTTAPRPACTSGDFGAAKPIWPTPEGPDYGPSLARDGLLLLFSRVTETREDLFWSERPSLGAQFSAPSSFDELSRGRTTAPLLSPDRLRIVFMSDRSGDLDLWEAVRTEPYGAFGTLGPIAELNTKAVEAHPWMSSNWLTIYFESNRDAATGYDIWQAKRDGVDDLFGEATQVEGITTTAIEGSPSFTADNLHLFYLSDSPPGSGRRTLFESQRAGSEQAFVAGQEIASLSQYDMNGYASVSGDGRTVVFSAAGAELQQLWWAERQCD